MAAKQLSIEEAERTVAVYNECVSEGFGTGANRGGRRNFSARAETARRLCLDLNTTTHRLNVAVNRYGLKLDEAAKPAFTFNDLPHDGEKSAEELIAELTERHAKRKAHHDAAKLRQVQVNIDGPIMLAFFGDPHVDDPGCAWGDLERDVRLCRETEGVLAVDVGDDSNNWVGRLAKLYAHQEITAKQSLKLIEWLMGSLPWLLRIKGNHDCHDMETEALTKRGWVMGDDIRDDDMILSLDGDGNSVWTPIIERIQRDNDEPMVSIEANALSLNVTPNHRVLHRGRDGRGEWSALQYARADSLPARFSLPVCAPSGRAEHPLPDEWIALTGWFLTDGGVHYAGNSPRVTFYQSKPAPELEAAIDRCGLSPRVAVRHRATNEICGRALKSEPMPSREYILNAEESRRFMAVAQSKGAVPSWVHDLSDRQFDVFLSAVIAGDGAWASNGMKQAAAIHGTKAFLSSLQAACVSHGWSAHLSCAREKDWRLNVCRRREWQADKKVVVHRAEPSPRVWCLRVPFGNFMIRRRGKAHFSGNSWNTEKGDVSDYIHRLFGQIGGLEESGARLELNLPSGAAVRLHVRHDFPGGSQFNPAHALVRETLFGHRDHILACGHRHTTGYIPIWHNDPRRLCHGFRVGAYKDFDHYAKEKGFQEGNWARSLAAVIDPDHIGDPVRYIKPFFSLEDATEYLTWRRGNWSVGRRAA